MSGLFADLAARARGEAQAVRPRLPARFETSAQEPLVEIAVETPAPAPAGDRAEGAALERTIETLAPPALAAPPSPGDLGEPAAEPAERPRPATARQPPPDVEAAEVHAGGERAPPFETSAPSAEPRDTPASPRPTPRLTLSEPERAAPAPQRPTAAAEAMQASPPRPASEPLRPLAPRPTPARADPAQPQPSPAHEETTVHVSIGRIELRAAQVPPAPAARPREPAKPAVMSLEDYLQSRRARR